MPLPLIAQAPEWTAASSTPSLLHVRDLVVTVKSERDERAVVAGVSFDIRPGKTLGVVGESGCGKTMTALAAMGLLPPAARANGSITLKGRELLKCSPAEWRGIRGSSIAMVFQEPMTALNPVMPIGRQIGETLVRHEGLSWRAATDRAIALLEQVGIPSARQRAEDFPHQLSGGMRQRAMIAMALACRPDLLVADEPTTALDVTIQAQILDLMLRLQDEIGMAILFISHNLGVISEIADEIIVMYAGRVVEHAASDDLFAHPLHPYTQGLIATIPDPDHRASRLPVIAGSVPSSFGDMTGCRFADRCAMATSACRTGEPQLIELTPKHRVACFEARP